MAAPKGIAQNPRGRPVGIRDKRMFYTDVKQALRDAGADPVQTLITIMQTSADESLRVKAATELSKKYLPDLKAIEHKTDDKQHADLLELRKKMLDLQTNSVREF